jgi:hypothetical protein
MGRVRDQRENMQSCDGKGYLESKTNVCYGYSRGVNLLAGDSGFADVVRSLKVCRR